MLNARCYPQRPELVVQTGHTAPVMALAGSPDGQWLASGSVDSTVAIWDLKSGRQLRILTGHTGIVSAVAFSPDGRILASGSYDHTVRLWDTTTGALLKTIPAADEPVFSVTFGPNGRWLATASWDQIRLWDENTGTEIRPFTPGPFGIGVLAFSPDGRLFTTQDRKGRLSIHDVLTGRKLLALPWSRRVTGSCFSPDSRLLATTGKEIVLWDAATGRQLAIIDGRTDFGSRALFSADSKNLIFTTADHNTVVWNISSEQEVRVLSSNSADTAALVGDPNGRWIAWAAQNSDKISVVNPDGQLLRVFDARVQLLPASGTFTADGRELLSGMLNGAIVAWDLRSGRPGGPVGTHSAAVTGVSLSPDGTTLASGSWDHSIRLWNLKTGQPGKVLVGHTANVLTVVFSPDGRLLASGSQDLTVRIWDIATGQELRKLDFADLGPPLIRGSNDQIAAVAFSPDGKLIACSNQRATIKLFYVTTGEELRTLAGHTNNVESLSFSPDGSTLASGSYDHSIRLWAIPSGRLVRTIPAHAGEVTALAFTHDGRQLISASADNEIKIWDPVTGANLRTLSGHTSTVWSISISRDQHWLASQSADGTTRVWDLISGKLSATLIRPTSQDWLVVTPDGLFDGSPEAWKQILWRFDNNTAEVAPVESFFSDFYHPGLLSDIFAGKTPHPARDLATLDRRLPEVKLNLVEPPDHSAAIATRNIRVRIRLQDQPPDKDHTSRSGARDLRLFRNGSLVRWWHGDLLPGNSQVLETEIPITAGDNRVTAYAFNHDNVKSEDADLSVTGAANLQRKGIAYVLAVGINQYASSGWNLRYAESDAREFAGELAKDLVQLGTFGDVRTVFLLNGNATKANLLAALNTLAGRGSGAGDMAGKLAATQPEDAVFIYYAGHGTAVGPDFYLIPHDLGFSGGPDQLDEHAVGELLRHSLSDRELESAFETMDAGQVTLIIDACRSGQALHADDPRQGPMNSGGLAQLAYDKGMYILTASQGYQAALELSALQHGLLTYALVDEGLRGGMADDDPKDGMITLREWLDFATVEVPKLQLSAMEAANRRGLQILVVEGEQNVAEPENRSLQQPRVFYRREAETQPFIVTRRTRSGSQTQ